MSFEAIQISPEETILWRQNLQARPQTGLRLGQVKRKDAFLKHSACCFCESALGKISCETFYYSPLQEETLNYLIFYQSITRFLHAGSLIYDPNSESLSES